jgi:hypothetical protein
MTPSWLFWPASSQIPWTPDQLGTLAGWWKADAITGLFDGDDVTSWADSSGNGYNLGLGSSGAVNPTYEILVLNNLPVVRMYDAGRCLAHTNTGITIAKNQSALTIATVSVARATNLGGRADIAGVTSGANSTNFLASLDYHRTSSKHCGLIRRAGSDSPTTFASSTSYTANTGHLRTGVWDWSTGNLSHYLNGTQDPASAVSHGGSSNTENTDNDAITVGGFHTTNVATQDIDIGEIIMANTISSSDREKLEGYLAHKWGLEGDLPAGHPYKSSPPYV